MDKRDKQYQEEKPQEEWKLLVEVTESESIIIESLCRSLNIPVIKKYSGVTGYFKIVSCLPSIPVLIYVPASCLDKAKEALKTGFEDK